MNWCRTLAAMQYWEAGAELLHYTFPGWTAANTQHAENFFPEPSIPRRILLLPDKIIPSGIVLKR